MQAIDSHIPPHRAQSRAIGQATPRRGYARLSPLRPIIWRASGDAISPGSHTIDQTHKDTNTNDKANSPESVILNSRLQCKDCRHTGETSVAIVESRKVRSQSRVEKYLQATVEAHVFLLGDVIFDSTEGRRVGGYDNATSCPTQHREEVLNTISPSHDTLSRESGFAPTTDLSMAVGQGVECDIHASVCRKDFGKKSNGKPLKESKTMIDPLSNYVPNPYRDVWHFFKENRLPSERGDWRLTDYVLGEINGLPKSRGWVVATNGLMCYIQIAPDVLYYGHFTAWVPDKIEKDAVEDFYREPKTPKSYAVFADY